MNFEELILLVDAAVYQQHQKHLRDIDVLVLRESLQRRSYDQIADAHNYTGQYLRQDVGPKLWNTLSTALDIKIAKKNCATVLEDFWTQNKALQRNPQTRSQAFPPASQDVSPPPTPAITTTTRINWGPILTPTTFYGRKAELEQLQQWILLDRVQLLALIGMGGMGKTALAYVLTELIQSEFDFVLVCSMRNAPNLREIFRQIFDFAEIESVPSDIEDAIAQCIQILRDHRYLLILDNLETLFTSDQVQNFAPDYQHYRQLLKQLADQSHNSCVIIASRELPQGVCTRESVTGSMRTFRLSGLTLPDAQAIMQEKGLKNLDRSSLKTVLHHYAGNPLALKIVAAGVFDLGQGDLRSMIPFLEQGILQFENIDDLLGRQFQRLDDIEQQIMYWLALHREPLSLAQLNQDILSVNILKQLPRAVQGLTRRSMVERNDSGLALQPAVMAYVIRRFLDRLTTEVCQGQYVLLQTYALLHTEARDSLRDAQQQFILRPLLTALINHFGSVEHVRDHFLTLLDRLRIETPHQPSYACGNVLNLLRLLDGNLNGLDCSNLSVWQAYLVGLPIARINFNQADLSRSVLSQVLSETLSVCFSPDGKLFATANADHQIRIWRVKDHKQQQTYHGHRHWVSTVTFCPESQVLISGSFDKTIKLWDLETGQCLDTLEGHTAWIWSVVCSPDNQILASCSDDHTIRIWDRQTGQCLQILNHNSASVRSLAFSPCGQHLVSAASDITAPVKIWDWTTGTCRNFMPAELKRQVSSIAFSPDGQYLATGSHSGETEVWDVVTGHCIHHFSDCGPVTSVVFAPPVDQEPVILATGSGDQSVKLWNIETGSVIRTFQGHSCGIGALAFHPHSPLLISSSNDSMVKLWDTRTGDPIRTFHGYSPGIKAIALSPNGQQLVSSGDDTLIHMWDVQTYQQQQSLQSHSNRLWTVVYIKNGTQLLSAGTDHQVERRDIETGEVLQTYPGHRSLIFDLAVHEKRGLIASASEDYTVRLWNMDTGECIQTLAHDEKVWAVDFSPGGHWLAYGQGQTKVKIWDIQAQTLLCQLNEHQSLVWTVVFSPDGQFLATASDDGTTKIWNTASYTCLLTLRGHTGSVRAIAFSPDGTRLATGGNDHILHIWSTVSGERIQTLHGHESTIWDVTFRGNDEVVSASQAGLIKIWDLTKTYCTATLRAHRPYEGMDLRGSSGLTDAQKMSLATLGATL